MLNVMSKFDISAIEINDTVFVNIYNVMFNLFILFIIRQVIQNISIYCSLSF